MLYTSIGSFKSYSDCRYALEKEIAKWYFKEEWDNVALLIEELQKYVKGGKGVELERNNFQHITFIYRSTGFRSYWSKEEAES